MVSKCLAGSNRTKINPILTRDWALVSLRDLAADGGGSTAGGGRGRETRERYVENAERETEGSRGEKERERERPGYKSENFTVK